MNKFEIKFLAEIVVIAIKEEMNLLYIWLFSQLSGLHCDCSHCFGDRNLVFHEASSLLCRE